MECPFFGESINKFIHSIKLYTWRAVPLFIPPLILTYTNKSFFWLLERKEKESSQEIGLSNFPSDMQPPKPQKIHSFMTYYEISTDYCFIEHWKCFCLPYFFDIHFPVILSNNRKKIAIFQSTKMMTTTVVRPEKRRWHALKCHNTDFICIEKRCLFTAVKCLVPELLASFSEIVVFFHVAEIEPTKWKGRTICESKSFFYHWA